MKEIIIGKDIEAKRPEITAALAEIQKRCTARTITFEDVRAAVETVTDNCPVLQRTHREGIRFELDPNGQRFPNAYTRKGRPQSTIIRGEFKKSGLKITFERGDAAGTDRPKYSGYSREQAFRILEQAGCETWGLEKAVNLYENQTGKHVFRKEN